MRVGPLSNGDDISQRVSKIASRLQAIPNILAVVLGGSCARRTALPGSDLDIGIYYHENHPPDIEKIRTVARTIAVAGTEPIVSGFYDWGPWVNGGAWIRTEQGNVDFLFRNVVQVMRTIEEAKQGKYDHDFHQQPTFGFTSIIYLAEVCCLVPLYDTNNLTQMLKKSIETYPPCLKQKIVHNSLWSAEFTLVHAYTFAKRADNWNTICSLGKIGFYLLQTLYALNETYYFGDKGALQGAEVFTVKPAHFQLHWSIIFDPSGALSLIARVDAAANLWSSVADLVEDYSPKFKLT
ncbi:MAG: nucleotidyltransferase domain-containing protein [Verrucomicrobia bacterium]|nr:nucleotidyltransferase domain-containing protein [Verrucomicrobiota bacterium]